MKKILLNCLHRDSSTKTAIISNYLMATSIKRHLASVPNNDSNGRHRHCDICSMTSHVIFVHDIWKIPMADSFFGFDTSLSVSYNQFLRDSTIFTMCNTWLLSARNTCQHASYLFHCYILYVVSRVWLCFLLYSRYLTTCLRC